MAIELVQVRSDQDYQVQLQGYFTQVSGTDGIERLRVFARNDFHANFVLILWMKVYNEERVHNVRRAH